jgi:chromosome partitioning protein
VQVISFMNMKGGVGKTTLAVNVAYGLAQLHRKTVLIVDGDPQFNATQYLLETDIYFKHINDPQKGTLRDIFVPRRPGPVNTVAGSARGINRTKMPLSGLVCPIFNGGSGRGKLDLIPSTLQLMDIETSRRQTEGKLKAYLGEKASGYDYVIIDCPPTISIFTQAAILASDKYLVPIKPDPLSVIGLPLLERWLDDYTDDAGVTIEAVGLVYTLVRGNTPRAMREVMADLRKERQGNVFADHLSESVDVSSSVDAHLPVFRHKPNSKTSKEVEYITAEFLKRTTGE